MDSLSPRSARGRSSTRRIAAAALGLGVLAAVAAPAQAAGHTPIRPFIVNGEKAEPGRYPFMVSLQIDAVEGTGQDRHFCGGTLIDPEWVLTAAHCSGFAPGDVSAVVGLTRLSSNDGQRRDVAEIFVHPDYNPELLSADVALWRLAAPVTGITPVEPARPAERSLWEAGDPATTIGWGVQDPEAASVPDDLQQAAVAIQPDATMSSPDVYGTDFLAEDMLGAGPLDGGTGSCFGDSGGPLLVGEGSSLRQIGVVSWGQECAGQNSPAVYSRMGEGRLRSFVDTHIPLRVGDASTPEGGLVTFTVNLARPSTLPVTASYRTVSVTATSGVDFTPAAGVVALPAGATTTTVTVPVAADDTPERDETFRLTLSSLENAVGGDLSAVATILDDDLG